MSKRNPGSFSGQGRKMDPADRPRAVSRRQVLAGASSAALVGLAGSMGAQAQYTGIMEEGGGRFFNSSFAHVNAAARFPDHT